MSFAQERERRANAGSRMKALLDEQMDMEVLFDYNDNEADEEFSDEEQQEMDVLDSDFDIDSSEGEQEEIEEGHKVDSELRREERQETRKIYIPPPSAATAAASKSTAPKIRRQRKPKVPESSDHVRYSSRKSTVLNRVLVEEQRKENEIRRAAQPKRKRLAQVKLTQEELLAEAAITEEKNKHSLLEWQEKEELRKSNARKKEKKAIQGPFIRYHSFADGDLQKRPKVRQLIMIKSNQDKNTITEIADQGVLDWHKQKDYDDCDLMGRTFISFMNEQQPKVKTKDLSDKELEQLDLIEQCKSWLKRTPKPNTPTICPITGQVAKYCDPRTGIPFFNKEAFRTIRSCLDNEQGWSSSMGLFAGDIPSASGVPKGWDYA